MPSDISTSGSWTFRLRMGLCIPLDSQAFRLRLNYTTWFSETRDKMAAKLQIRDGTKETSVSSRFHVCLGVWGFSHPRQPILSKQPHWRRQFFKFIDDVILVHWGTVHDPADLQWLELKWNGLGKMARMPILGPPESQEWHPRSSEKWHGPGHLELCNQQLQHIGQTLLFKITVSLFKLKSPSPSPIIH